MITCPTCGKTNGEGDIGEHWICDSCKVPEPAEAPQPETQPDQADR